MNNRVTLRAYAKRLGDIRDVLLYLNVFSEAYNHLYAFDLIVDAAKKKHEEMNKSAYGLYNRPVRNLATIKKPEEIVLPADRLWIKSVDVNSPGFWEFWGSINPFEILRKYLCDRHERKKDIDYRDRQQEERGELEIEMMKLGVVKIKSDLLKEIGVPNEKIRKVLYAHVIQPLKRLDEFQDRGFILDAQIIDSHQAHTSREDQKF